MSENVVYLHGPTPVGHYLRVGTSGHRQLETLHSSGRLGIDRVVFDAAMVTRQRELISLLSEAGSELILDPNVAELSCVGRFGGVARGAPWANPEAVLTAEDLSPTGNRDVIGQIARFAVQEGFHAVLAPTHLLYSSTDPLFTVDLAAVAALRAALDRHGGHNIGIDYPLLIPYASLRDPVQRRAFIGGLSSAPFDNLWCRVSGFGANASAAGLRRYIAAVGEFHRLDRPIVADGVGGLAGVATAAFGAVGGICHGVAEKERFDATGWNKPPAGGGGGREKRVLVDGLDRLLSVKQVEVLMASPTARRHFSCSDPSCCPRGLSDTLKDPKAHYLRQRRLQIAELSRIPESRRAGHFLEKQLAPVKARAQQAAKLEIEDASLSKMLSANGERLEKTHAVLSALQDALLGEERSASPVFRRAAANSHSQRMR